MNRERFEELARLKGMDTTSRELNCIISGVCITAGASYINTQTRFAKYGWDMAIEEVRVGGEPGRERFEFLASLCGMDVTRANRRITFVNLEVIEVGEYISRMTEAAWWGWQEAMKEKGDE